MRKLLSLLYLFLIPLTALAQVYTVVYAIGSGGSTQTINPANGNYQTITLTSNLTISFTQPPGGNAPITLAIKQASSGGPYTVTCSSVQGTCPSMSTAASSVTQYSFLLDGTNTWFDHVGNNQTLCTLAGCVFTGTISSAGWSITTAGLGTFNTVAIASDGVHAGFDSFVGNTTAPTIAANTFNLIGPNVATFTAYGLQFASSGPSVASTVSCGPLASSVSPCSFITGLPVTQVTAAASTPAISIAGTPFTGGSGTTTVPFIYYNAGTAPTGFNTSGTLLGLNSASGFSGNLIDLYTNGSETFQVASSGFVRVQGTLQSAGLSSTYTGNAIFQPAAPTIASGFGTGSSVVHNNGSAGFTVNVGTGGTASSGVVNMPTASTGWACTVAPNGAPQAAAVTYSAPTSATSITLTNYTLTTGIALAWSASAVLQVTCWGY
jgi:hypothetical protein